MSVAILAAVAVFLALPTRGNEIGVAWQLGHFGSRETCLVDTVASLPKPAVIDCGRQPCFTHPWSGILVLGNGPITKYWQTEVR